MKKLLLLIIAAGVAYLNHTNPTREEHEALLLAELQAKGPVSEQQFDSLLKEIDYSSFLVCSATKTTLDSRMITLGYLKQVRLADDKWVGEVTQKLQGR